MTSRPKKTTKRPRGPARELSAAASAMPARSAPTLRVLARKRAIAAPRTSGRGSFFCSAPARPSPVTSPIRAHIIWMAAMRGQVKATAVQRSVRCPSAPP